MMASFWPSPMAMQAMPEVAEGMNRLAKFVASRTLESASWRNTTVIQGDLVTSVREMKKSDGPDLVILGSGSIVSQLSGAGLIDEFQIIVNPLVLGQGRTLFEGVTEKISLKLIKTRAFSNGNVILYYEPQA
jgi:dihydrofolate reductase